MHYNLKQILLDLKHCKVIKDAKIVINKEANTPFTKVKFYFLNEDVSYKAIGCPYFLVCCELTAKYLISKDSQNIVDYFSQFFKLPSNKQFYSIIFEDIVYEYRNFK